MAEKSFGVKDLNIVQSSGAASGDPTIESNGDLNLKAGQVAIQTNVTDTGVITANNFIGDGSGLTGVSGSGSGVIIKNNGTTVGTAGSVNFGSGLNATTPSAGLSTISIASNINVTGVSTFQTANAYTFTVGAGGLFSNSLSGTSRTILTGGQGGDTTYYSGGTAFSSHIFRTLQSGLNYEKLRIGPLGQIGIGGTAYGNAGDVLKSNGSGGSVYWGTSSGADPNSTFDTVDVVGIVTAGSFVTDLIPSNGTGRGFCTRYYITASGTSSYRFAGPGQRDTVGNPTLYLMRGFSYMFENSTGGSHPFRIQYTGTSTGVGTYVSGSQTGIQIFTIPHDAPPNYQYQCTVPGHGAMLGSFVIPS